MFFRVKNIFPCVILVAVLFPASGRSQANFIERERKEIVFTENKGQVSDQYYLPRQDVLFGGRSGDLNFHLRKAGVSYQLYKVLSWRNLPKFKGGPGKEIPDQFSVLRLDIDWIGCNDNASVETKHEISGTTNFYNTCCPNGVLNVKGFSEVTYKEIYNGIDLRYYSSASRLKYDYIVKPKADPNNIKLRIDGAEKILIQKDGSIVIKTILGDIKEEAPVCFQNGKRINAKWKLNGNILSFDIEKYNPNQTFIIDPLVVLRQWGTYYGDVGLDQAYGCVNDPSGDVYIAGITQLSTGTLIATVGSHQTNMGSSVDGFISKFNSNGIRLWGTYYGGDNDDYIYSCALDNSGNLYACGTTSASTNAIATIGAHQLVGGGSYDAFLVKFNSVGVRQWGTYYGGVGDEDGYSCAIDNSGNVIIAGITTTGTGTSVATVSSGQPTYGGSTDGFMAKFNSGGVRQWGSYYGGNGYDRVVSCSTDPFGNIFLAGDTGTGTGFAIAGGGAHQPTYGGGGSDGFVAKFASSSGRIWGSYYGGFGAESTYGCAADALGNVFLCGGAGAYAGTIIATPGSFQPACAGNADGYIAKFNPFGARLWGTYYGETSSNDYITYLKTDPSGNIYCTGYTFSNPSTVFSTPLSHQQNHNGACETFLSKFSSNGTRQFGTYYGGTGSEQGFACSVDAFGGIYLAGFTQSSSDIATLGSHQSTWTPGGWDAFLVKFYECNTANTPTNLTIPANQIICSGLTTTLSASSNGTISWYATQGSTIALGSGTDFVTPVLGAGTYSYFAAATNTCLEGFRTQITITVNSTPTVSISGSGSICAGQSASLVASGANTYSWSNGSTLTSVNVSPTITTSYTVIGTSNQSCSAQSVFQVTVNANPTISVNSGSICSGQSFTMNPSGAATYTFGGGGPVVSPTTTSSYTITGTSGQGCTNTVGIVCNLSVNSLPTITVSDGTICLNESFMITPAGAQTYTFSGGSSVVSPTSNSTFTVSGTDLNGCINQTLCNVVVKPLPGLTVVSIPTLICVGEIAVVNAAGGVTYTWSTGATSNSISVSPTITTIYTVTANGNNGCENKSVVTVSVDLCLNVVGSAEKSSNFLIYPNPSSGVLFIAQNDEDVLVKISDMLGRQLLETMIKKGKSSIDLTGLSRGIYFLSLKNGRSFKFFLE